MAKSKPVAFSRCSLDSPLAREVLCGQCKLHLTCRSPYMPAYVPSGWTSELLIVGEAPGAEEDQEGRQFVGKAGKVLWTLLNEAGFSPAQVATTNANRCRPEKNATPTMTQVRACRPYLMEEILALKPRWVLATGNNAIRALFNDGRKEVKRSRQRAYSAVEFWGEEYEGISFACTYHPSATFYHQGNEIKTLIKEDLVWLKSFRGYSEGVQVGSPELDVVGLDVEWDKNYLLSTVAVSDEHKGVVHEGAAEREELLGTAYSSKLLVGHNILGDLPVIRCNSKVPVPSPIISGARVRDTLLTSRMWNENLGAFDLESLAVRFGVEPWKAKSDVLLKKTKDMGEVDAEIRKARCLSDAWAPLRIFEGTRAQKDNDQKLELFTHVVASALKRVEMAGVYVAPDRHFELQEFLKEHLLQRKLDFQEFAYAKGYPSTDQDYEPTNDNHFRTLLFDILDAEPSGYTKKKKEPAIDADNLTLIYQVANDVVRHAIELRLRYEKVSKLFSTYVEGLCKHLSDSNYVFQSINALGAKTGRRSSEGPNMQNWPERMRQMVVSRWPEGQIIKSDHAQLEPRILAVIAGIDEWLEIFTKGGNLYKTYAKKMWGKDVEKGTTEYKITKETILGTNYNMEPPLYRDNLSIKLGIELSIGEAADLLKKYHGLVPPLARYHAIQRERLLKHQAVQSLIGRIRRLPCPEGERTPNFKHLWNVAVNHPIQSTASDVTGAGIVGVEAAILQHLGISLQEHFDTLVAWWAYQKLKLDKEVIRDIIGIRVDVDHYPIQYPVVINEVHDEIDVDSPTKEPWVAELVREEMEACRLLRKLWPQTTTLPLLVEQTSSYSWAS